MSRSHGLATAVPIFRFDNHSRLNPGACETERTRDPEPFLVSSLSFASCYAYAPSGDRLLCQMAREMCARLKAADPRALASSAAQVWRENVANGHFAAVFGRDVVLVPVPESRPGASAHWVGERLAWCLRDMGLACAVWPCLRRRYPVRKSAFAAAGERPTVLEHYASFAVERAVASSGELASWQWSSSPDSPAQDLAWRRSRGAGSAPRLVLIDDVVTRGRTLLAAAARLRAAFPGREIRAFALMRTLERGELPWRNPDPCEGEVRWLRGDARRRP